MDIGHVVGEALAGAIDLLVQILLQLPNDIRHIALAGAFALTFWISSFFSSFCAMRRSIVDFARDLPHQVGHFWFVYVVLPFAVSMASARANPALLPSSLAPRASVDQLNNDLGQERRHHDQTKSSLRYAQDNTTKLEKEKSDLKAELSTAKFDTRLSQSDAEVQILEYQKICLALITALYSDIRSLLGFTNFDRVFNAMQKAEDALDGSVPWRRKVEFKKDANDTRSRMQFLSLFDGRFLPAYPFDEDATWVSFELQESRKMVIETRDLTAELEKAESDKKSLEEDVRMLKQKASSLQDMGAHQKETISQLKTTQKIATENTVLVSSQSKRIEDLKEEKRDMKTQLQEKSKRISEMEAEARSLQNKINEHATDVGSRNVTIARLEESVKHKDTEINNLRHTINDLDRQLDANTGAVASKQREIKDLAEKGTKSDELKKERDDARSQLQSEIAARQKADQMLENKNKQIELLQAKSKAKDEEADQGLQDQAEMLNAEHEEEMQKLRSLVDAESKARAAAEKQLETKKENEESALRELKKCRREEQNALSQAGERSKELQETKEQLSKTVSEKNELNVLLGDLEIKHADTLGELDALQKEHAKCPKGGEGDQTAGSSGSPPFDFDFDGDSSAAPPNPPPADNASNDFDNFFFLGADSETNGSFSMPPAGSSEPNILDAQVLGAFESMEMAPTGGEVSTTDLPSSTPLPIIVAASPAPAPVPSESSVSGDMEGVENTTSSSGVPPPPSSPKDDSGMEGVESSLAAGPDSEMADTPAAAPSTPFPSESQLAALMKSLENVPRAENTPAAAPPAPTLRDQLESLADGRAAPSPAVGSGMAAQQSFPAPIFPPPTSSSPNVVTGPHTGAPGATLRGITTGNNGLFNVPTSQPVATPLPSTSGTSAPRIRYRPEPKLLVNPRNARPPTKGKAPAKQTPAPTPVPKHSPLALPSGKPSAHEIQYNLFGASARIAAQNNTTSAAPSNASENAQSVGGSQPSFPTTQERNNWYAKQDMGDLRQMDKDLEDESD